MKRVVTSLILIPAITWVVLLAPPFAFAAAVCLFAALCWMEYAGIAAHYGARFTATAGWIPGIAFLLIQRDELTLLTAFYVGRAIGTHKLAPSISPGKSWEGAIASAVAAGFYGIFFLRFLLPEVPLPAAALLAVAGNAAGQIGDLAESALKRGAGVKDSGTTLPGHGGWLDRLDSSLFSMPVVHLLIRLI